MRFESSGIIIQENIIDYSFRRTTIFSFFRWVAEPSRELVQVFITWCSW
jgi:hypothetical protein